MRHKKGFADSLAKLKNDGLYRRMYSESISGAHVVIDGKKMLNLCSNDYLGIPPTKIHTTRQMQSSSRLLSGNDPSYMKLESKIARHKSQNDSLVYPTGYMANIGAVQGLVQKNDTILSDSLNHASIIDACRLSGGKVAIYGHNNVDELEHKLKSKTRGRRFIITEGVFSMDGDMARLKEITEIAKKYDCTIILDDAHGDFALGYKGKGTANLLGVTRKIDVYVGSLSKGLGSFGGYVASDKSTIELLANRSRALIYTSALPPQIILHASKRMDYNIEKQRKILSHNVKLTRTRLYELGYDIGPGSHIIPIIIGNEHKTVEFASELAKDSVFAQPIRYPTVSKNAARIRLSITAWLSENHIEYMIEALGRAGKKHGLI